MFSHEMKLITAMVIAFVVVLSGDYCVRMYVAKSQNLDRYMSEHPSRQHRAKVRPLSHEEGEGDEGEGDGRAGKDDGNEEIASEANATMKHKTSKHRGTVRIGERDVDTQRLAVGAGQPVADDSVQQVKQTTGAVWKTGHSALLTKDVRARHGLVPHFAHNNLATGQVLWTTQKLAQASLPLAFVPQDELAPELYWQPFLIAKAPGSRELLIRSTKTTHEAQSLNVPLASFAGSSKPGQALSLDLSLGASVASAAGPKHGHADHVGEQHLNVQIISLSGLSAEAPLDIKVQLGGNDKEGLNSSQKLGPDWLVASPLESGSSYLTLALANASQLQKIFPFLHKAAKLNISAMSTLLSDDQAIHLARDGQVVASLQGEVSQADLKAVCQALGISLAFRGRSSALLAQPDSIEHLTAKLSKLPSRKRVLIFDQRLGDKVYPVTPEFLTKNHAALSYVHRGALALFSEQVEVLSVTTGH